MKIKSVFVIGLLLLTLCSISAIYADTYVVGNSSFSLPDGYALSERGNQVLLFNDKYVMTMYEGPVQSIVGMKYNLINSGYTFVGENEYDFDGVDIHQQNYNKDGVNTCVYIFEKNGHNYVISLNLYEDQKIPDYEDNPVTELIHTLEVVG